MKLTTLAIFLLGTTSALADDAILNIEGSLQINGRTVINNEGFWTADKTELTVDCEADPSALLNRFNQGYRNFVISAGACYAPRWFEEMSRTSIKASDDVANQVSLIRMPNDEYDLEELGIQEEENQERIDNGEEPNRLYYQPLMEVGIGGYLYIRDVNIVDNPEIATWATVQGDIESVVYLRNVNINTNADQCTGSQAGILYLRQISIQGCNIAINAGDSTTVKLRQSNITGSSIELSTLGKLFGYGNTLTNVGLNLYGGSALRLENEIQNVGTVNCYDGSSASTYDPTYIDYCVAEQQ